MRSTRFSVSEQRRRLSTRVWPTDDKPYTEAVSHKESYTFIGCSGNKSLLNVVDESMFVGWNTLCCSLHDSA